jgi:endonuclease G
MKRALLSLFACISFLLFASDNLDIGTPGGCDQVIDRPGYALGYVEAYEQAAWVQYHFTKAENQNKRYKRGEEFYPDPEITTGSATLEDYKHPIYDRGHMAPAADMQHSAEAMHDSFYLSNMSPQHREMNAGIWADIEKFVRYTANVEKDIYVITGPIFGKNPKTIGPNQVAIPDSYYKIIYDATPPEKMLAFIVPNHRSNQPIHTFVTTVDEVEKRTKLDFFSALPKEQTDRLEASSTPKSWKRLTNWYRENLKLPWER